MVGATRLSPQGEDAGAEQERNEQQRSGAVSPSDTKQGMNQQAKENDCRLIRAEVRLFGISHHRIAMEGSSNPPLCPGQQWHEEQCGSRYQDSHRAWIGTSVIPEIRGCFQQHIYTQGEQTAASDLKADVLSTMSPIFIHLMGEAPQ